MTPVDTGPLVALFDPKGPDHDLCCKALAKLDRALALMDEYRRQPMDLADASIVTAAERLKIRRVFTLDRRDFRAYSARIGHKRERFRLVP